MDHFGHCPPGDVGIDGAVLDSCGVAIREIAGGCMCCVGGVPFRVALTELIRRARPSRVLIEPSGLGRVSEIKRTLAEGPLATAVEVCATLCLVPADMHADLWGHADQYEDQVFSSDALVINRRDLVDDSSPVESFAREFFPPKLVALATHANFDAALLDAKNANSAFCPPPGSDDAALSAGSVHMDRGDGSCVRLDSRALTYLIRTRIDSTREGRRIVGWRLDQLQWLFDRPAIEAGLAAFARPPVDRAKAVFRTHAQGIVLAHWGARTPLAVRTIPAAAESRVRNPDRARFDAVAGPTYLSAGSRGARQIPQRHRPETTQFLEPGLRCVRRLRRRI